MSWLYIARIETEHQGKLKGRGKLRKLLIQQLIATFVLLDNVQNNFNKNIPSV